jgi:hypothetical protein
MFFTTLIFYTRHAYKRENIATLQMHFHLNLLQLCYCVKSYMDTGGGGGGGGGVFLKKLKKKKKKKKKK